MNRRVGFLFLFLTLCGSLFSSESDASPDTDSFPKQEDLKEIAAKNPKVEFYRLTVSRSFDPILVIEIGGDAILLQKVRQIEERVGDSFDSSLRLVRNSRIPIDPGEFNGFKTLQEAGSFWDLPGEDWQPLGLDGSTWVLEGIKNGKYHRVERSNPFIPCARSPLEDDLKKLSPERAYSEGRLIAGFMYLWGLSGEANEKLY